MSEDITVSRRALLRATAGGTAVGLAGCSSVTNRSFAAEPVRLPQTDREALNLPETAFDSGTTTQSPPVVDGEITITTHVAAYRRGSE